MDVDVDLNAKYAIMCCKKVIITEDDEESTNSDLRQHSHIQLPILSAEQEKR